jgi:hypothetical protein
METAYLNHTCLNKHGPKSKHSLTIKPAMGNRKKEQQTTKAALQSIIGAKQQ